MKKAALKRTFIGSFAGITIGYIIPMVISLTIADGNFYPCVPSLVQTFDSEVTAVVVQTAMSAVLGGVFGGSSVIWEMESWSLAKQTGVYFALISLVMLPVAYFSHWMPHNFTGALIYFSIFTAIFFVIWTVQYLILRSKIKKINNKLA